MTETLERISEIPRENMLWEETSGLRREGSSTEKGQHFRRDEPLEAFSDEEASVESGIEKLEQPLLSKALLLKEPLAGSSPLKKTWIWQHQNDAFDYVCGSCGALFRRV